MILKPATATTANNNNRNKYAPSSAPWKRPEAEMEETDSDDDSENHKDPGAFRVVGRQSISVLDDKQKMDLIQVAQQVGEDLQDTEDIADTENARSSIVSVGSAEGGGDAGTSWDTETATMDMLVQLKRRSSTRKLILPPDNTMDEGADQQQQQQQEVLSTDCHWADGSGEEKEAAHKPLNRPSYAASTAPWTRPTGERQVSSGEVEENHTTPGAFRISKHQDSKNGLLRQCDRISFSDDMEEDDEQDDIVVMKDEATGAAFPSSDLEQSKEVLEQLKRRKERKLQNEM
jgi:hypothetical protein